MCADADLKDARDVGPARRIPARHRSRRGSVGAFLLEVLVVVVLCAIGMIGLISLQSRTGSHSVEAEDTVRAALLASELGMRMWTAGTITLPDTELDAWSARIADTRAGGLPEGRGEVTVTGERARIVVSWRPPRATDGTRRRYVTDVLLP